MTSTTPSTGAGSGKRRPSRKRFPKLRATGKRLVISVIGEDRYLRQRAARQIASGKPLLLVHTMGKVGSTSVAASLKSRGIKRKMTMYQPHFLSEEGIDFAEKLAISRAGSWQNLTRKGRAGYLRNRLLNEELRRLRKAGGRVKVITMVRDPLATNLSGLFHNYRWWPAELKSQCNPPTSECLATLERYFLENYTHDVPDTWFDMEVKALYGVDVFAEPFDPARGYAIYRNEFADVLLIKLEQLNQCAADAIHEFLGIENFQLEESNTAEDKEYAAIYQAFRKQVTLPESYLDRMYTSRMAGRFYSPEEIAGFRRKWSAARAVEIT
ncbi:MAG TPA: putative capsular polysaccharide synthesis family protein [Promineifilum sp.]|nr:putative capsular polysaccharide synthesis family protein [Promineifilum sp.]HRQ11703.1 putative capsular polysaccharide synthesis family protein [Promineifilum sp.]